MGDPAPLQPKNPIELVKELKAPVLGLYASTDAGIPQESVDKMKAALKAAGNPSDIIVYPESQHGFHADYRPTYKVDAAKEGWAKLLAHFK